jgi:hypothetical protein
LCGNEPQQHVLERILPTGAAQLIVTLNEDETRLYEPEPPHRCHIDRETFPGPFIDDRQALQTLPIRAPVEHKVIRPDVIPCGRRHGPRSARCDATARPSTRDL